ncbi:Ig-like domain-containing protein [Vibrio sp. 10N.261.46.E11]|uniref:Ig-like domain-containing protein n=1 Tax=Vibrio sp. 10N.261.46.E11 TaxID=3229662 RepID=UPI00354BF2AF
MKKTLLIICMLMLLSGCGGGGAEGKATDNSQVGSGGSGSGSADGSGGGGGSDSGGSDGSGGGDGSGSGGSGGSVQPPLSDYETLPLTFTTDVVRNGQTVKLQVSKYSARRSDTKFYYYDAAKSLEPIAFEYTPEVRSYRGKIVGEAASQVVGYVNSKNIFYGFVFYGEDKAWTIDQLVVPNINTGAKKKLDPELNRQPKELIPTDTNYQLPVPSLVSPIPTQSQMKLQMSSLGYLVDIDSFETSFNKDIIDAVAAMDHTTNALDYFFARDALIRVDYPIGLITVNSGGKTASELYSKLKSFVQNTSPSPFSIFQNFFKKGQRCAASGLSSSCDFQPDLAHTLHEIGHTFSLGHHVGPETNTLMNFALAIDTNMISTMKSSGAIEQRLAPAMESKISPKANIVHVGTSRNTSITVDVLDNDFDANGANDGGRLSLYGYTPLSQRGGKVERLGSMLKYTPAEGYVGEDHFSYTITDDSGLKDSSEVHVSVKSKARVLYLSDAKYTTRQDIKNHAELDKPNFDHLVNRAGREMFFGKVSTPAYPNSGFYQYIIDQTSTNTPAVQTEPTFEENNLMTLQKHMPHDLVPGKQSFSIVTRYKQDGYYQTVSENRGIHEVSLYSSGKLDEGFALSHFNGNRHRPGEPEKGLGWTLVGRQMFSRQSFDQKPHVVHAFAKPDAANITDNTWHSVAWVIDRENNNVSTWVDGTILPMALSTDPTNFMDYVPLPRDFGGVYPGGTYGWIDSSWDASTEGYGPWFMRTNGSNTGSGANNIWVSFTKFISDKFAVDDVQIYTYALPDLEIKSIATNKEKAFTNSPVNGHYQSFSKGLDLTWDSKNADSYKVNWGYDATVSTSMSEQTTQSLSITPDSNQKAIYWRVDSKYGSDWIEGNVWSVTNSDVLGEAIAITFTKNELTDSAVGSDNDPWPINSSHSMNGIDFKVEGQVYSNDASILRLSKGDTITITDNNGKDFSQMRFSASQWTDYKEGFLKAQYHDGSEWITLLTLDKGGVASGYGYLGEWSHRPGIASTSSRGSKPDWYDPSALSGSAYYTVTLPNNVSQVRLKFESVESDKNQIAIDQLNVYR